MNWIRTVFSTSIGKKQFLAVTGLGLIGFACTHLLGNLTMVTDAEAFNHYAEFLTQHPLILPAEAALAGLFLAHIIMGVKLFIENLAARPQGYAVLKSAGGRTVGSSTMPYTGLLLLVFVCVHVFTLRILNPGDLFDWVIHYFRMPLVAAFYVVAMILLGVHLSHGVQSVFQTFGFHHDKYTPGVKCAGTAVAILLAVSFGFLPIWGFLQ